MYDNPGARGWRCDYHARSMSFHKQLPGYAPTRLVEVPDLAREVGVGRVFVKEESARFGLPAFKMLGASYAIARLLAERFDLSEPLSLASLRSAVREEDLTFIAATDGNHGRAVAHTARLLGLQAHIYVPASISNAAKGGIRSEGATVHELDAVYDDVVRAAAAAAEASGTSAELIQDTAWEGYERIPGWIVSGYSTLFEEIDQELAQLGIDNIDLIAVPVGVGSLVQTAVQHYRSATRYGARLDPDEGGNRAQEADPARRAPSVLSVEPEAAPTALESLRAGKSVSVQTGETMMAGLNCGTLSQLAWPELRDGMDLAVTVSEDMTTQAVRDLRDFGIDSGPCGAATLAGVRRLHSHTTPDVHNSPDTQLANNQEVAALHDRAVVVLLSTESLAANPQA